MSGSIGLSTDPLADSERVDVRRFCGYPAYGSGNSGFQSARYFQAYGLLEYRLSNLAVSEFQVVRQYLSVLYGLEANVSAAAANLDTDKAAVWTRNRSEITDRTQLFDNWCRRLVAFIGVPPGPALMSDVGIVI